MVDAGEVRGNRRQFAPVERGVTLRDYRPGVRIRRRFACEVPTVELSDGGVEVVEIEPDDRDELVVVVDLVDREYLGKKCFGPFVATRQANTPEQEVPPAG